MSKWALAIICGALLSCTGSQEGPDEVQSEDSRKPILQITEEGERTTAEGDEIKYILQLPPVEKQTAARWPIVVLFHGFSRDHSRQIGTGRIIADRGLLVLVPDMTTLMTGEKGRRKNVEVLADHLQWLSKRNSDESDPLFYRLITAS